MKNDILAPTPGANANREEAAAECVLENALSTLEEGNASAFCDLCGVGPNEREDCESRFGEAYTLYRESLGRCSQRVLLGPPLRNPEGGYMWLTSHEQDRAIFVLRLGRSDERTIRMLHFYPVRRMIPDWKEQTSAPISPQMQQSLLFEPAGEEDIGFLTELMRDTMPDRYREKLYDSCEEKQREALADGDYYTIRLEGRKVGAVQGCVWDNMSRVVGELGVCSDMQNKGIGAAAIDYIQRRYDTTPIWWVSTFSWGEKNRHFYEKQGFFKVRDWQDPDIPKEGYRIDLYGKVNTCLQSWPVPQTDSG